MSARNAALLDGISPAARIIELGASYNPIAPRSAGWATTVVDHDTQAGLVAKYREDAEVDTARIENVDFVWGGGPLDALFPIALHGSYRALIASHVIEHLPDPLGFLDSCARLLDPADLAVLLAVPDKRWCFDVFKPLTTAGQWFAAHRADASRHSRQTHYDHVAYAAFLGERVTWGREPLDGLRFAHPLEAALHVWAHHDDSDGAPYVDAHAWHFTPASFELLILEAAAAGFCDWRVDWVAPQAGVEFLARLRRGAVRFASPEARDATRLALLHKTVVELHEQSSWLVLQTKRLGAEALSPDQATRRQIQDIAETAAMVRKALLPARAAWRLLGPLRRVIARGRSEA